MNTQLLDKPNLLDVNPLTGGMGAEIRGIDI